MFSSRSLVMHVSFINRNPIERKLILDATKSFIEMDSLSAGRMEILRKVTRREDENPPSFIAFHKAETSSLLRSERTEWIAIRLLEWPSPSKSTLFH